MAEVSGWQRALCKFCPQLEGRLNIEHHISSLHEAVPGGFLTSKEQQDVMSQSPEYNRVRKLVKILTTKDVKAFAAFAVFLKEIRLVELAKEMEKAAKEGDSKAHKEVHFTEWMSEANIAGWMSCLRNNCSHLGVLVIGETGFGKSTLINNLLGNDVAKVGDSIESDTSSINRHEGVIQGVPVKVYDTPGLGDSRSERDEGYLYEIKELLSTDSIHLIIYCFKMADNKMRQSIIHTFQKYTEIGVDWKKTVIALTFADEVPVPSKLKKQPDFDMSAYFEGKVAEWRQKIPKVLTAEVHLGAEEVEQLKINPTTDDHAGTLPNGEEWYIPFWLDVLEVLPPIALVKFLDIHKDNIRYGDKEKREVPLCPVDLTLPPLPKELSPPPYEQSVGPTIAAKNRPPAKVGDSNQAPVMVNLSISNPKPDIVLNGENQVRFERTIGSALQTAAGMAVGGITGAALGTLGAVGYTAAVVGIGAAVTAPISVPIVAVAAAAGALGVGVAKLFGWW